MSQEKEDFRAVRLYAFSERDGSFFDLGGVGDYDLSSFAGCVPSVGDLIVSPGVSHPMEDRRDPANRTVYEVVSRYFMPGNPRYVALVVKERVAHQSEENIIAVC